MSIQETKSQGIQYHWEKPSNDWVGRIEMEAVHGTADPVRDLGLLIEVLFAVPTNDLVSRNDTRRGIGNTAELRIGSYTLEMTRKSPNQYDFAVTEQFPGETTRDGEQKPDKHFSGTFLDGNVISPLEQSRQTQIHVITAALLQLMQHRGKNWVPSEYA